MNTKKNSLLLVTLSLLLLPSCGGLSDSIPEQTGTDPVEEVAPAPAQILETTTDGEFSFTHRTQGANYFVDINYQDKKVGEFFKDAPTGGVLASVFKTTERYAYLALEMQDDAKTLSGPEDLARLDLETLELRFLTFNGTAMDVSSDDSKLAFSFQFGGVGVMDMSQALYPNGRNVTTYTPEGANTLVEEAHFSDDGTLLYYTAQSSEGTRPAYTVDLSTGIQEKTLLHP